MHFGMRRSTRLKEKSKCGRNRAILSSIFRRTRPVTLALELAFVAAAVLTVFLIDPTGLDLKVYREGGLALLNNPSSLYDPILGPVNDPGLPFTYPPFAALIFVPIAVLPFWLSEALAMAASLIVTVFVAQDLAQRIASKWRSLEPYVTTLTLSSLFVVSGPFRDTLWFGQINILILGACYLTFVKFKSLTPFAIAVGIFAGIKLTPIAFLILPLAMMQWRAMFLGIATFVGTQVIGLLFSFQNTVHYWTEVLRDPTRVGNLSYLDNVSIQAVIDRFSLSQGVWFVAALAVGVSFIVLLWKLYPLLDRAALIGVASACPLLVSPVSWAHHWVWWPVIAYGWIRVAALLPNAWGKVSIALTVASSLALILAPKSLLIMLDVYPGNTLPAWCYVIPTIPVIASTLCLYFALGMVRSKDSRSLRQALV